MKRKTFFSDSISESFFSQILCSKVVNHHNYKGMRKHIIWVCKIIGEIQEIFDDQTHIVIRVRSVLVTVRITANDILP